MNVYHVRQLLKTMSIYDLELKVGYYARVSTEKEEQKNSIVNQRDFFEDLIKKNRKWHFCGGYIDDGISGIHADKRENFQKMLEDARLGKIDLIITKEISRFARNTLDSIQYTRQLLGCGVCVWFLNDNINTIDDDSEFRLTIMAGVAQDEVRKLSSRVRFGHAQAIKNGVVLGNSRLYGYNKEDGKLTINPEEAEMVRVIFRKYAYENYSTPSLEKLLYEMGYRNYKGGKIDRGVIQHIIRNPKYKGYYCGGKVKIIDMFTKKQEFIPPEQWTMFKDEEGLTVPAIIDEVTWEKANLKINARGDSIRQHRTSYKKENLFTGKIFCGNDGSPYWLRWHYNRRGIEDPKWYCSSKIKNGAASCTSFGVSQNEMCCMIADLLNESIDNLDHITEEYLKLYQKAIQEPNENPAKIKALEKEIGKVRARMDKILDYNLNGSISDEDFLARNAAYSKQLKQVENELAKLQAKPEPVENISKKIEGVAAAVRSFSGVKTEDIDITITQELIKKIIVYPTGENQANVDFYLNNGEIGKTVYRGNHGCRSGDIFFTIYPPTDPFSLDVRFPL